MAGGSGAPAAASPEQQQEAALRAAQAAAKQHAFHMKRALDDGNLRDALRHTVAMLNELRTGSLAPQRYYALYMQVFDELSCLEAFCFDEHNKGGRSIADLYEFVQHAGNILPRLYLLITIGSVYVRSKGAPAKDVLSDLVEMTRGVQHPVRGLFLRTYLSQVSKSILPDAGSQYEGEGGSVRDAVDFVLKNFTEMNKLWVRMQQQGGTRDRARRQKERQELRDLVGKNLLVLSQLDGVDLDLYRDTVLPRVLEQVVNCKDELAQPYLMDAVIQVFPDEFHLQTLETLLDACKQLQPAVRVGDILAGLMVRLAKYAAASPEAIADFHNVDAFEKFRTTVASVAEAQPDLPAADLVSMHAALQTFAIQVHGDRLDYVDQVLAGCAAALEPHGKVTEAKAVKQTVALLSAPLDAYDVVVVLSMSSYPKVMEHLEDETNKQMAVTVVRAVLKGGRPVADPGQVEMLFEFIGQLVKGEECDDEEDFAEEQNLVARLIHFLRSEESDSQYRILQGARKYVMLGSARHQRYTLPPLVFAGLRLAHEVTAVKLAGDASVEGGLKKVLQFVGKAITPLADMPEQAEQAYRLFLQGALAASVAGMEPIAYEFMERAFDLYEESITNTREQISALQLMVGTLQRCGVFSEESRDALVHKAGGYSKKLLKKPDQCRAVYACAHLFWGVPPAAGAEEGTGINDGASVLRSLKAAIKIANAAQQSASAASLAKPDAVPPIALFVELLNKYLYFFDQAVEDVTPKTVQGLMDLVAGELANDDTPGAEGAAAAFHRATLAHARAQQAKGVARYDEITVS